MSYDFCYVIVLSLRCCCVITHTAALSFLRPHSVVSIRYYILLRLRLCVDKRNRIKREKYKEDNFLNQTT